jgi:peptide/nickel transport system substrate-binding protein
VLLLNLKDPLLSNPKMRQAIAHALDLPAIAAAATNSTSEADPSSVAPSSPYFDKSFAEWPRLDAKLAAELARQAGYTGQPITIETNQRFPNMYGNAVMVQSMLAAAGFDAKLEVRDWATQLSHYLQRGFQIQSFAFSPRTDPALSYATFIADTAKYGWAQWDDPKAVALLSESLVSGDEARRKEIFKELQASVRDQVPIIGLFYEPITQAVSPKLHGWTVWPTGKPITWGVTKDG